MRLARTATSLITGAAPIRLSPGDVRRALEGLLGEDAAGLSPTNIARLTACWEKEYRERDLTGRE